MATGIVKKFFREKNFGFIQCGERNGDLFFHVTQLVGNLPQVLHEGMEVEFDVGKGRNGKACAVKVRLRQGTAAGDTERACAQPSRGEASPYRFLNPYNFVRPYERAREQDVLGDDAPPPHDRYAGLTGSITCELTTVTPLFSADSHAVAHDAQRDEHKMLRFLQVNGQEVISGSSLRGMLRQVYETVTHSCFAVLDHGRRLSYRLPPGEALGLVPGRVKKSAGGEWTVELLAGTTPIGDKGLQHAAWIRAYAPLRRSKSMSEKPRHAYSTRAQLGVSGLVHGEKYYARMEEITHPARTNLSFWNVVEIAKDQGTLQQEAHEQIVAEGYVCITNQNIDNKHDERFFFHDPKAGSELLALPVSTEVRDDYNALLGDYYSRHQDDVEKRKRLAPPHLVREDKPAFSRFVIEKEKLKEDDLVYAKLQPNPKAPGGYEVEFLAPVMIPRLAYEHRISDLLPATLRKCSNGNGKQQEVNRLCPACRLFGWVYGRPQVNDNALDPSAVSAYRGRLSVSHAVCQRKATWEVDAATLAILSTPKPTTSRFYLADASGKPIQGKDEAESGYNNHSNRLRGRKFYRHHARLSRQELERCGGTKDDQNRSIQGIVGPDSRFTFTIHFENLAPEELGGLLWTIELEPDWCHRLGMARALGFGSVQLRITDLLRFDPQARYQKDLDQEGISSILPHKDALIKAFKDRIVSLHANHPPAGQKKPSGRGSLKDQLAGLVGGSFDRLPPIQDLKALLSTTQPELPVHYPRSRPVPTQDGKNFEWFMGNKRSGRDAGPRLALPLAPDDTQGFPLLDKWGKTP